MNKLDLKIKILEAFLEDDEMAYYYSYFEKRTGASRKEVKEVMDELRHIGIVEHIKGLFNEEGETAGSGFSLTYRATQLSVREWLTQLKEIQSEALKTSNKDGGKTDDLG